MNTQFRPHQGFSIHRTCNGSALRKATRRISSLYGAVLAPSGLRQTQHSLLAHVDRSNSPTLSELASDLVLDRTALSHNLKPLERDGYLAIVRDANDNRVKRVMLTEKGKEKLAETTRLWSIAHNRFERLYGKEKAELLREMLADVYSDELTEAFERAGAEGVVEG
ncbi:MarR family winged helix-turn-helix transcriptional regulator [Pseudomonas abietaniphila]|uniref:MarR family winged helix-turn-helix transcriptional regulator n=1 Tax=Pseudomonas abietaniphila TaxID=89065 RepID=UPI003217FBD8